MAEISKGRSPFYPGQPVPVELFVGRAEQIQRIQTRGAGQVALGKPVAMFIQGEYGIGKSSIAGFAQWLAERDCGLHGVYAALGGAKDLTDVAYSVLQATVRSGAFNPSRSERMRNWLAKYIGKQDLFGFSFNLDLLRKDAPNLSTPFGMLGFLSEALERLKETGAKGIFLVLDEINGIAAQPDFAHFIKGLVDANAMSRTPLPLLLMLCGVEERRREMIRKHQPVDRIFDIVDIETMNEREMGEFFTRAFESIQIRVEKEAMSVLTEYSAGFPKIMHLVGDAAFWTDSDGMINEDDAFDAVFQAAEEVGKKYVDQQVYRALRSKDYHSILSKLAKVAPPTLPFFQKDDISKNLTETEKKKLSDFLRKMKSLKVLRSGDVLGQYVFNSRMVQIYIRLQSRRGAPETSSRKQRTE